MASRRTPTGKQDGRLFIHVSLAAYAIIAVFPVVLIAINSLKSRKAICGQPRDLPGPATFSLRGYETVWSAAHFQN